MTDYTEQINSLLEHADLIETSIELYGPSATRLLVYDLRNAAAAIENMAKHITEMHERVTVLQIDRGKLEADVDEQKQIAAHYEQSANDWWKEACDYKAQLPHWVSVEEPPKRNGRYLVSWEGVVTTDEYKNGVWLYASMFNQRITHWMPLPEPPQEVQDADN